MKHIIFLSVLLFSVACAEEQKKEKKELEKTVEQFQALETLDENGKYTEWYPGHEQIKVIGRKDDEGKRQGIWKLYTKDGIELSLTVYKDGQKDGYSIVRYPTGIVRYSGKYDMNQRVGEWRFYDQSGQLVKTEKFPEQK
jgi:antitoxin component YwqK of YwqJK toxin-antitoxin module